jgi:hypothetical protein
MDYQAHFAQALAKLRDERRYRVFLPTLSATPATFHAPPGIPLMVHATSSSGARTIISAWVSIPR